VSILIIVLGVVGLLVAAAAVVDVCRDAGRRRQYVDIAVIVAVAAATVWVLIEYGDVIMQ
jgi:hypothetical protein